MNILSILKPLVRPVVNSVLKLFKKKSVSDITVQEAGTAALDVVKKSSSLIALVSRSGIRNIFGIVLILVAVALLLYDFFSPPVGELSNFTLIVFAKIIAIAGSLMNINFSTKNTEEI